VTKPARYRYRSAMTGRYVCRAWAERNPSTTVRERVTSRAFDRFCKGKTK
jgi:hypothetical protein